MKDLGSARGKLAKCCRFGSGGTKLGRTWLFWMDCILQNAIQFKLQIIRVDYLSLTDKAHTKYMHGLLIEFVGVYCGGWGAVSDNTANTASCILLGIHYLLSMLGGNRQGVDNRNV